MIKNRCSKFFTYNILLFIITIFTFFIKSYYASTIIFGISLLSMAMFFDKKFIIIKITMGICLVITLLLSLSIIGSLLPQTFIFFNKVSLSHFLFNNKWAPYPIFIDGTIQQYSLGILPLLQGTLLIAFIAMCIGIPIATLAVIYVYVYARKSNKRKIMSLIDTMAGIPSVIYGYFAINIVAIPVKNFGDFLGMTTSYENSLTAGIAMSIMLLPLLISLIYETFDSMPNELYYGSLAMGSTKADTVFSVILPYSATGMLSSFLLGLSRCLGETMVVLMATGLSGKTDFNIFAPSTTITVQIVALLSGEYSANSVETSSAYALGTFLLLLTCIINCIVFFIMNRYKNTGNTH